MKKIVSIFLVILLSLSCIPFFNLQEQDSEISYVNESAANTDLPKVRYYYRESNDNVTMTADEEAFETEMEPTDTVEVVFEMGYAPEPCNCRELLTLDSTDSEVDAIKERHREEMKTFYSEKNAEFMESNDFLYDAENCEITVSEYSPFIQMVFDDFTGYEAYSDSIVDLADESDVSGINIGIPVEYEPAATRVDPTNSTSYPIADAISDISASNQTYKGTGVKVGIIEAWGVTVSRDHPDLANLTIHTGGSTTHDEHAEFVTRILCGSQGVARNVEAAYVYHSPTTNSVINAMNWMVNNSVDVINISMSTDGLNGQYHWTSALLDTYAYNYFITIVACAGNDGNKSNPKTKNYGMGYNVITVGNLDSSRRINNQSSYGANSGINTRKPTISAPGTWIDLGDKIDQGTSYSAPMVAGVIAKLIDEKPGLAGFPEILIASLIASATPVALQGNGWDTHAGAGRVNYQKAREAINNASRIINESDSSGEVVNRQISVQTGKTIKVAAFWFAKAQTYDDNDPVLTNIHTNYNLHIANSAGTTITSSTSATNIEYIKFNSTTHTSLKIIIQQYGAQKADRTDYGGIAWVYE